MMNPAPQRPHVVRPENGYPRTSCPADVAGRSHRLPRPFVTRLGGCPELVAHDPERAFSGSSTRTERSGSCKYRWLRAASRTPGAGDGREGLYFGGDRVYNRRVIWLERIWHDVRHACRLFAKNPGFTAIAVISIAFGTGANVAMFSAADALLLRPLPVPRPSELVTVGSKVKRGMMTLNVASYPDYVDIREQSRSFDGLLAFTSRTAGFSTAPGAPPQVKIATIVSGNFFRVLDVQPEIGRGFLQSEDLVPGRDAVAVLSYGMWQKEFGGERSALGRKIHIAGIEFTVIGVMPERFTGIEPRLIRDAAYVPLAMWPQLMNAPGIDPLTARDFRNLTVKGRLKPGVTIGQAQAELTVIGNDLERAHPHTNKDQVLTAQTELEVKFERSPLDSGLLAILSVLSTAVLCVACANVAGLLASRAPVRAREIAVRLAIGAGRARLVWQLITESLGIALAGALGGVAVGYAGIILLRQIEFPTDIVALPVMALDNRALVFSLVLAIASAFLFGLGPAIQTTRVDLVNALKATDVSANRRLSLAGRNVLVGVQVALSLVLLTIAAFAFQIFRRELGDGPGFRTSHLAKLTLDTTQARYSEPQSVLFFERALDNARHLAGVRSATVTSSMPLLMVELTAIVPEGFHLPPEQARVRVIATSVDESYFDTMAIRIVAGRPFRVTDRSDAPRVAIVNATMARHYWPGVDAVGKRFRLNSGRRPLVEIVGVAETAKYVYFAEPPQEALYFPFRQQVRGNMVVLTETAGESAALLPALREMLRKMDPEVPVYDVQTIEVFYAARVTTIANVIIRLIGGIGLMGMALTMVGLYGLVSYAVSRRTREIGIRIAVGASYRRILRMILRQGMTPVWCGVAAGLVLSSTTTRLMLTLIPVSHHDDSQAFAVVVPLLVAVTLLAAFVPARRAARVDPTVALRCD